MFSSARKDTFPIVEYKKLSQAERLSLENDVPHRRKNKCSNPLNILIFFSLFVLAVSIISIIGHVIIFQSMKKPSISNNTSDTLECDILENSRFDCWPEKDGSSEEKCQSRGCCWKPASVPETAPYCYFPSNYKGYHVVDLNHTRDRIEAILARDSPSIYPKDVKVVKMTFDYMTDSIFRIKFTDPNNERYEVPLQIPPIKQALKNPLYHVEVSDHAFSFAVKRATTGEILFDTNGTAPLIFSDQYLQIGTRLSTKYFYGFGEHRSNFLHDVNKWERLVFWNRDDVPKVDNNGYGSHPFLLNIECGRDGSSVSPQNNSHGIFLLNSNAGEVSLQPFGEDGAAVTYRFLGGMLDFFVMVGPEPVSVISQYLSIIGHPYLPPFWSLGFHLCRWGYNSSSNLQQVIKRNRDAGMPYDVQWNDIDYMHRHKDWTFDNSTFSSLPAVVRDLHDNNQRYVIIVDPAISSKQAPGSYPPFDDGIKMNIFMKSDNGSVLIGMVWPGLTAFPDFFHPNATAYQFKQASSYHKLVPFDGLWIDMNEPSSFIDGSTVGCTSNSFDNPPYVPPTVDSSSLIAKTVCPSAKQFLSRHYNLHNMYGWSNANVSRAVLNKLIPDKRSLLITRSSFSGSGALTGHWLGDNYAGYDDLFFSIPGILRMNLYGISQVGADICGFRGNTNPELCTRWMQLGAFYPFMRNHNTLGALDQDPASFASPYKDYMRSALQLRYQLLPLLYTLFYQAHTAGLPVVRPLLFIYPGTEAIDKQFMWGDQLMISPVLEQGEITVDAYIPNDIWYDFYNGSKLLEVGQVVSLTAPLDCINVHVRGGSILALLPPTTRTDLLRKEKFIIVVAPDVQGTAKGNLFWDDGESLSSVSDGKYSEIVFFLQGGNKFVSVPERMGYKPAEGVKLQTIIAFDLPQKPSNVTVNGRSVNATYDIKTKKLEINNLDEDLLSRIDASWI